MTTFGGQADAIFRKNGVYQRRAICTNICLLLAPIIFCVGLAALQVAINATFSGQDYKCGCKCVDCCFNGKCGIDNPVCDGDGFTCNKRDKSNCSPVYSTAGQITWCPIEYPNFYPPLQQNPPSQFRAKPARPADTLLYTSSDDPAVKKLVENLIPGMDAALLKTHLGEALNNIYRIPNIQKATADEIARELFYDGRPLSRAGLEFGTEEPTGLDLYRDEPFVLADSIAVFHPPGTCAAMAPLVNGRHTLSQTEFFIKLAAKACSQPVPATDELSYADLANLTSCLGNSQKLQELLDLRQSMNDSAAGDMASGAAGMLSALRNFPEEVECVEVKSEYKPNVKELDRALYCGYNDAKCFGRAENNDYVAAFDLTGMNSSNMGSTFKVVMYQNSTVGLEGGGAPVTYFRFQTMLNLVVNSWMKKVAGKTANLLGVQSMPKLKSSLNLDFSSILGPLFYSWVVQLLLPTFLVQLVYEKEKKLRMMMKMHGLGDVAYWVVMYTWYLTLYILYIIVLLLAGSAARLRVFTLTSYGIQIIHYFLFGNCMIAFAFLLSCFFTNSRTAVVVALLYVFGTGLMSEILFKRFMERDAKWMFFVQWIPSFGLYRGIWEFAEYAFLGNYQRTKGLTFDKLSDPGNGVRAVWGIFIVEWALFMLLAWYLEQVLSNGTGVKRHPLFFLPKFKRGHMKAGDSHDHHTVKMVSDREDVEAERMRVEEMTNFDDTLIVVKDLRKVYPGQDGAPPKVAVQSLTLGIDKGECFGLLGPNGAGKSTSINMMTGFLEPSGGQAILAGFDLATQVEKIYGIMGVCPQHDLLWETLTAREHLLFYGRLKGLKGSVLTEAVDTALKSVNLYNRKVGDKMVKTYSGGMKRRLSVAISFIGNPSIVYLDEPSTGLDPASRRNLWDVVKGNKRNRSIILTTHSMEEAEVLCDRLGIFVDGRLVCVGNPKEITARYGGYYVFTLMVTPESESTAMAFVKQLSPSSVLTYHVGGTLKYEVPASEVTLSAVFNAMQQLKQQANVLDWGISNATLEEVFIKFARSIGATEVKD